MVGNKHDNLFHLPTSNISEKLTPSILFLERPYMHLPTNLPRFVPCQFSKVTSQVRPRISASLSLTQRKRGDNFEPFDSEFFSGCI
jgi:hypothetical protein